MKEMKDLRAKKKNSKKTMKSQYIIEKPKVRQSFQENGRVLSVGENLETNQTMDNMRSPTNRTSLL